MPNNDTNSEETVIVGTEASPEDIFFADLGDRLMRDSPAALNQSLRQMILLSAAFLGGLLALFPLRPAPSAVMSFSVFGLLFSLFIAIIGAHPFRVSVIRRCPYDIRQAFYEGAGFKTMALNISTQTFCGTMAVLCVGVVFG